MKYMLLIHSGATDESGGAAECTVEDWMAYDKEVKDAGILVSGESLADLLKVKLGDSVVLLSSAVAPWVTSASEASTAVASLARRPISTAATNQQTSVKIKYTPAV